MFSTTRIVFHCFKACLKLLRCVNESTGDHMGNSQALIRAGLSRKEKRKPRVRQPEDEELGLIGIASVFPLAYEKLVCICV